MSDKEGFKVPSLPVGRAKLAPSDEYVEAKEQESESQKVPEDSSQQEQTKPKAIREESSSSSTEQLPLSYVEPHWSSIPDGDYSLLIVKNGAEIGNLALNDKPYHTFGRLPNCDVTLEHPSISRYHALLQYRPEGTENQSGEDSSSGSPDAAGFYVYDLGSTHGTYLNKQRVRPRSYCRLRIGQMVKFGGSTRLFILEAGGSGQEAVEEEAEREIAALERHKEEVKKREQELAELEKEREAMEKEREKLGVTWGMVDDEIDLTSVGKADEIDLEREAYYRDDPKKALRKYFDKEDLELEFETVETGKKGVHCIRVSLPVQSAGGEMVVAEATLKGKKKEAVTQCALEACRLLDSYGMLRQASQGHKKKVKNWEEDDFYSSDEDSFLDRTGTIEKKRHSRMKKMGKAEDAAETFETLNKKLTEVTSSLQALEERLARAKEAETTSSKGDSLDVYMKSVKEKVDKGAMYDIKLQINKLKKEETKLRDLVKLAQPTELPALKQPENDEPPVASKPNPNKKQYGLTKLPVDRKQAYLREMAAKDRVPVKADNDDDECVVEYDSDDDEHGDNSSTKVDTTNTTSDTVHEEGNIISDTDNKTKDIVQDITDDKMSGQSANENNEVDCRETEDDQKVVSPKKRKMIGASLGPLRKRNRRRSSETTEEVTPTTQWSNDYDPDYASWLPPEDQSGDGKTHLNAKYGY